MVDSMIITTLMTKIYKGYKKLVDGGCQWRRE